MKYLVTGGGGFIGAHLSNALLAAGHEVTIIDNFVTGYKERVPSGARLIVADLIDYQAIEKHFVGIDGVFHTAAVPRIPRSIDNPVLTHHNNVNATFSVFEAARHGGVKRVVFSSSSTVYGLQDTLPFHEDMKPNPICPYGAHKVLGEHYANLYAMFYGVQTVSLRYFSVYGPGMNLDEQYALAIPAFIRARQKGLPLTIFGNGEYTRDCTHVRDVVRANILAMESPRVGAGEILNIGAGHNVSINYLAKLIGGTVEYKDPRKEVKDTFADHSRARELLGWQPTVAVEDGIAELKTLYGIS